MKKILVVGQNPSDDSIDNSAFHKDTKSGKLVREWFKNTDTIIEYANLYDYKHKDKGRPAKSAIPKPSHVEELVKQGYLIVGCGGIVQDILTKYKIEHLLFLIRQDLTDSGMIELQAKQK